MLASDGLSASKYVSANKVYANIDSAISEVNTANKKAAGEDGDYTVLTLDGFVDEYLKNGLPETSEYARVDAVLDEKTGGDFSYDSLIKVSRDILGKETADGDYAGAMLDIKNSVDGVVKILSVLIFPVLILGGAANMFITVNTLPLVLEIGGLDRVGTFTGYYYTATFSAQIASPIIYGFVAMVSGTYMSLFYYSPIAFALCLLCLIFVKHGEAIPQEIVDKIEEENAD